MTLDAQDMTLKNKGLKIISFLALLALTYILYPKIAKLPTIAKAPEPAMVQPLSGDEAKEFAKAEVFAQTLQYLSKNYYDTEALNPRELLKEALLGVSRNVPEVVVDYPEKGNNFILEVNGAKKKIAIPKMDDPTDFHPAIQEAFGFIARHYDGETALEDIQYVSINGMLKSLDPHSALLPPKIFKEFKTQTEGEFGGIGIVIGLKDDELTVIAPLPNTPAGQAGLRTKDKIVQIGEEATINMSLTEAVERLRGKVGTSVDLVIEREGASAPIEVTLVRDKIKIESVQAKLLTDPTGDVGVLKIKSFQEETLGEIKRHLRKMKSQAKNFKGVVLDLRNNPGGLLNQAIDIADLFLKEGTIVLTVGAKNQVLEINRAHGSDADENYPLVVLVNEGSASASEIVSGALKKNNRAPVLGRQTFGKGSVQSVYALKGGAALKITVAQYLTPGKASIQSVGITPDIKLLPMSVDPKKVDLVESETFREKDLDKHLESDLAKNGKPVYLLEYFQPTKDEDEEAVNTYTAEIDPNEDFELQIAQKILLDSNQAPRADLLKGIAALVNDTRNQESLKVTEALKKIGVDWSLTPVQSGKPKAAVTFDVTSTAGKKLKAGEEVELSLQVRNTGNAPFHRLIATTESKHFLLKNREFIFGKVLPGETKTWKVPLEVPASSLSREDKVTFKFNEGNGFIPEKFQTSLQTQPLERPSYAYQLDWLENGQQGSLGDGDKVVDRGERITLKVKIENQGAGKSKETMVNLKNAEGQTLFLNNGRVKLDELGPGETKEAVLSFTVGKNFEKDEIELDLIIQDNESQEALRDKLKFAVGKDQVATRVVGLQAGPLLTLEKQPYPTKTKSSRLSITGTVSDPSGLKDLSVFVGENKAYLKTFNDLKGKASESVKESSFVAAVPLQENENNLITILARDRQNLTTRKSFYIFQE